MHHIVAGEPKQDVGLSDIYMLSGLSLLLSSLALNGLREVTRPIFAHLHKQTEEGKKVLYFEKCHTDVLLTLPQFKCKTNVHVCGCKKHNASSLPEQRHHIIIQMVPFEQHSERRPLYHC